MKAVFRHELSSYFTGMTGYVFGAFLLLFAGIYTMAVNLNAGLSNFEYVLSNLSFIFLIIVPILTMRVIAEERRQRTDQLLYSLPLSMTGVALGKYAALLVVFLVPTGSSACIPWSCRPLARSICRWPSGRRWAFSSWARRCWPLACFSPPLQRARGWLPGCALW